MSFFGGLKRALGWSGDDEDEDYISYNSSSSNSYETQEMKQDNEVKSVEVVNFNESDDIPEGVFDGLIEIINANLSPMVLKCLDIDAEKKYLYEALGPGFNAFVKDTREKSLSVARAQWDKEKDALNQKVEDFKSSCDAAENEMNEMKAMKMSEERQKMALKERLRILEDQVAKAEAEKEQYDLENKSLLNKLKVSQVRSEANEEAEKEIIELKAEIARLKAQTTNEASDESSEALKEEYNAKMEVNNALINELRTEATKNKELLNEAEKTIEELQNKLTEKEAQFTKVSDEYNKLVAEHETMSNEMAEMSENLSVLDAIQEQLEKVEDFKNKKAEEIKNLQEKILNLEQEKAKALEVVRDEDILKGRIAELELQLSADNEKMSELTQENNDTLDMLRKRDEAFETQKEELQKVKTEYEALKQECEAEINALKTAEAEKVKQFQAEIAELQARLNVNGKIDDDLIDDNLRQEVDETFDVALDESDFGDFEETDFEPQPEEVFAEPEPQSGVEDLIVNPTEQDEYTPEAELDDIDWLLPDTAESIIKEEEIKKEKEIKEQEELALKSAKNNEEPEAQMSLFG